MYIFVVAFAACAVFTLMCLRRKRPTTGLWTPAFSAAAAAFIIAATLLTLTLLPLEQSGQQRIAWTGVSARNGSLTIGDAGSDDSLGWPNGSFRPLFRAACSDEGECKLQMGSGGALVRHQGAVLNASQIDDNSVDNLNGFRVTLESHWYWLGKRKLRLDAPGMQTVVSADIPRSPRPVHAEALFSQAMAERRRDRWLNNQPDLDRIAMQVERWSRDVLLWRVNGGWFNGDTIWIGTDQTYTATVTLPAALDIVWPSRSLHARLQRSADGSAQLRFEGPLQRMSPVPGSELGNAGAVKLAVTTEPLPKDIAFLLPVRSASPFRQIVDLQDNVFVTRAGRANSPDAQVPDVLLNKATETLPPLAESSVVTSSAVIPAIHESVLLETIRVQPRYWFLAAAVFAAWLVFMYALDITLRPEKRGAYQEIQGIRLTDRWMLAALSVVVWTFLLLRLSLALRYAQDPAHLDAVAVNGVLWSLIGITFVPSMVLRAAFMWLPQVQQPHADDARRVLRLTAAVLLLTAAQAAFVEYGFWPLMSDSFRYFSHAYHWIAFALFLGILYLWTWSRVNHEYRWETGRSGRHLGSKKTDERVHSIIVRISRRYADLAGDRDTPVWSKLYPQASDTSFWTTFAWLAIAVLLLMALTWLVYQLIKWYAPGLEPLKEVIAPMLFILPPVCFLLNSRLAFKAGSKPDPRKPKPLWLRTFAITAALVLLLVIGLPATFVDPGAMVATLALFIPTTLILLAGGAPWRVPVATATCLSIGLLVAASLLLEFRPALEVSSHLGAVNLRVLGFRHGERLEEGVLFGSMLHPNSWSSDRPFLASSMRQTYQHLWEMQSISHLGGYTGVGFGKAPTRRSQVRQDTLQFDSTMSFFVFSEHGLLGGICLLCLYALPLLIVLWSARRKLDTGHALAIVIAAAFLFEAVSHSLMNLNALPETGRNLPWLAPTSLSDLLRWMVFFRILAQALLWRISGSEMGFTPEPALLPPPQPQTRNWNPLKLGAFAFGAFLLIATVAESDVRAIHDPTLNELTWRGLLDTTNAHIRQKHFILKNGMLEPSRFIRRSGDRLFLQEMSRFNEMTDAEKMTGLPRAEAEKFCEAARGVRTLADYDRLLETLRSSDRPGESGIRPSLFRLTHVPDREEDESADDDSAPPAAPRSRHSGPCSIPPDPFLEVTANPAFVTSTRFVAPTVNVPQVFFAGDGHPLIGPAWVEGQWVPASDPNASLSWIEYLRSGLPGAAKKLPLDASGNLILTLNGALQRSAMDFVAIQGRERHEQLLARHAEHTVAGVEPPRVALTVINIADGEVLAAAGYPRTSASGQWESVSAPGGTGHELLPPTRWVGEHAPASLRSRYEGDRNFERLLMGSSTKPLWAAAATALHPSLNRELGVKGAGGAEEEIFGIPVHGGPWEIDETSQGLQGGWCDLTAFLAHSDNRYQVRLGFLSLAEWDGDHPSDGATRHYSPGEPSETVNLSTNWNHFPVFPSSVRFSETRPGNLVHLQDQPIAARLNAMFGVLTTSAEGPLVRTSFWTGNEQQDNEASPLGLNMAEISPQRVDMEFDRVSVPRDYVTLLLGGGANRWSNIDFAGNFATAVTGHPVVPHIVRLTAPAVPLRAGSPDAAAAIQPGLAAAVFNQQGTVWKQLGASRSVLDFFHRNPDYKIYAKTGTLPSAKGRPNTSRLVLAMVRTKPGTNDVASGLVFSMVVDRGETGLAANWLGQFIQQNESAISTLLKR